MRNLFVVLVLGMLFSLMAIDASTVSAQVGITPELSPPPTAEMTVQPSSLVQIATPSADGSIVHEVVAGQTLIIIADAYGVSINEVLELNGMNQDSVIFPDQKLIIRAGFTATPTSQPSATATQTIVPTSTRRSTRTPASLAQAESTSLPAAQTQAVPTALAAKPPSDAIGSILLMAIAVLGVVGVLLIVLGAFLRRNA